MIKVTDLEMGEILLAVLGGPNLITRVLKSRELLLGCDERNGSVRRI